MNQQVTQAIVLRRTDYGEADRILTLLTPDFGKLSLLAKGVRRARSKLAGGIELFSVSEITFIKGRGEVGTLISTRLIKHYGHIVTDLDRTMAGYELIKRLHRVTEDEPEMEYFTLLADAFEALDDQSLPLPLISLWFEAQLLQLSGHAPNLYTDEQGKKLLPEQQYAFDADHMIFVSSGEGRFGSDIIKFLRLAFAGNAPTVLAQVRGSDTFVSATAPLVNTMLTTYLRV